MTAIPDEKKGEKLVVVYTEEAGENENLVRIGKESDLPNLWRPQPEHFVKVAALPLLGSGKLDLRALRKLAEECVARGGRRAEKKLTIRSIGFIR